MTMGMNVRHVDNLMKNIEDANLLISAGKYRVDKIYQDSKQTSSAFASSKILKELGDIVAKKAKEDGIITVNNFALGGTSLFLNPTKDEFNDPSLNIDKNKGLVDSSVTFIPTGKVIQSVAREVKIVSPIIIDSGRKGINKLYEIDNKIGSYISIKKDNLPLPSKVKKYTTDNIDYATIDSALPHGMPDPSISGAIGFGGAQLYDNKNAIIEYVKEQFDSKEEK